MWNPRSNTCKAILCVVFVFALLLHTGAGEGSDWDIRIGLGARYDAKYEGSDEMKARALPLIDVTWKGLVFLNPRDGLGVRVYNDLGLTVSVGIGYVFGRDESDSGDLRGMGDIDEAAFANLKMEYDLGLAKSYLRVSKHLGGSDGTLVKVGVGGIVPLALITGRMKTKGMGGGGLRGPALQLGVSATWADGDYMESYFGVNPVQSAASGYARYGAESGFKSVDFQVGVIYPFADNWAVNARSGYSSLLGDAAESPIVKDDGRFSGGLFLSYRF